jgi:hypothetical protein
MRALVVLLLAGCWHDVSPPPLVPSTDTSTAADDDALIARRNRRPGGPDCSSLGPAMEQLFNRTGFQNQMPQVLEAVTQSCVEDGWSMELVQCFIDASDTSNAEQCARDDRGLLSPQQMENLQRRLMQAMTQSVPQPPPTPPMPSP